jgi:2-polyprenyl-6-hydroxyphenyl methylase/3-demethylubiquinone-9 3-methyltransferase
MELVKDLRCLTNRNVLDIGAGGGLFLHLMREEGALIHGIEPSTTRVEFAKRKYNIDLFTCTVEDEYWQKNFRKFFDIVTMWDVIEHVNYPVETLNMANNLLKPNGLLCIDTPARDAFYYKAAVGTYSITRGKCAWLLKWMYSNEPFGHKQIFTGAQMDSLVTGLGFSLVYERKIHELSFPYVYYLRRALPFPTTARCIAPLVSLFFSVFRIRNKMIRVYQKEVPSK